MKPVNTPAWPKTPDQTATQSTTDADQFIASAHGVGSSSFNADTIQSIRDAFRQADMITSTLVYNETIAARLNEINTSPDMFLAAVKIAMSLENPTMQALGADQQSSIALLAALSGLLRRQGFQDHLKSVMIAANNDPALIITDLFRMMRR